MKDHFRPPRAGRPEVFLLRKRVRRSRASEEDDRTAEAIANATIEERQVEAEYDFSFEYPLMNAVMKVVRDMEARVLSQTYDMDVQMRVSIRQGRLEELKTRLKKAISPF